MTQKYSSLSQEKFIALLRKAYEKGKDSAEFIDGFIKTWNDAYHKDKEIKGSGLNIEYIGEYESFMMERLKKQTKSAIEYLDFIVLVLDDEKMIRELNRTILEQAGYRVLDAGKVEDALNIIDEYKQHLDLIITDMNGIGIIDLSKESGYNGKIILYTGGDSTHLTEKHGEKIYDVLKKPLRKNQDLVDKVEHALIY